MKKKTVQNDFERKFRSNNFDVLSGKWKKDDDEDVVEMYISNNKKKIRAN